MAKDFKIFHHIYFQTNNKTKPKKTKATTTTKQKIRRLNVFLFLQKNKNIYENDVLFSNDTGILGKRNSEFSQQDVCRMNLV